MIAKRTYGAAYCPDRKAVLILWTLFSAGCLLGALSALRISPATAEKLRESLAAYVRAAADHCLERSWTDILCDVLPWSLVTAAAAAFVSCRVTLPLLLAMRGMMLGYLTVLQQTAFGFWHGALAFGALCGLRNVLLLSAMIAVIVPNFTRALQHIRPIGSARVYACDRVYLGSILLSLVLTVLAATADFYLTPALAAMLSLPRSY